MLKTGRLSYPPKKLSLLQKNIQLEDGVWLVCREARSKTLEETKLVQ
jgi:hypothetical protein